MYRGTLTIDPDAVNFPLRPVWVGQGSAATFILAGLPSGTCAARIAITPVGESTAEYVEASYSSTAAEWSVYCAGWLFPDVGQTTVEVVYDVGTVASHVTYWGGKGYLTVLAASTSGTIPPAPAIIPAESYARDPITGLYHKIVVEVADNGIMTISLEQTGVVSV